MRSAFRWAAVLAVLVPLAARDASAQAGNTVLTITGAPVTFPTPTAADFEAGYVHASAGLNFLVDATTGVLTPRTTAVFARAGSLLFGTKSVGDIEWSLNGTGGPWNSLGTLDSLIETRVVVRNGANDPWGGTVYFRARLDWETDPPASHSVDVIFTLVVAT